MQFSKALSTLKHSTGKRLNFLFKTLLQSKNSELNFYVVTDFSDVSANRNCYVCMYVSHFAFKVLYLPVFVSNKFIYETLITFVVSLSFNLFESYFFFIGHHIASKGPDALV